AQRIDRLRRGERQDRRHEGERAEDADRPRTDRHRVPELEVEDHVHEARGHAEIDDQQQAAHGDQRQREQIPHAVARVGYLLSLPLVAVCGLLLIVDLGVPARFMNMILDFKFWDPMSIGAWAVGIFGAFAFVSSVLSFTSSESIDALRRNISLVGMLFGFCLAAYTGVLLSNSAMPFWADSRLMGALFLASGGSTGMAAVALIMFFSGGALGESWHKIEVADRYSMLIEILVL